MFKKVNWMKRLLYLNIKSRYNTSGVAIIFREGEHWPLKGYHVLMTTKFKILKRITVLEDESIFKNFNISDTKIHIFKEKFLKIEYILPRVGTFSKNILKI